MKELLFSENSKPVIIYGLPGIGKSQLAKKFIRDNFDNYKDVISINTQSFEKFELDFEKKIPTEYILNKNHNQKILIFFDNLDNIDIQEYIIKNP